MSWHALACRLPCGAQPSAPPPITITYPSPTQSPPTSTTTQPSPAPTNQPAPTTITPPRPHPPPAGDRPPWTVCPAAPKAPAAHHTGGAWAAPRGLAPGCPCLVVCGRRDGELGLGGGGGWKGEAVLGQGLGGRGGGWVRQVQTAILSALIDRKESVSKRPWNPGQLQHKHTRRGLPLLLACAALKQQLTSTQHPAPSTITHPGRALAAA